MRKEYAKPRVLFDTKPIIKLFAAEKGWEAVQKLLVKVEAGEIEASISVVTLTEVYYKYLQENKPELAKARTEQLRTALYLEKLSVTEDVAVKAGEIKGKHSVPIADALIAATAYCDASTIISGDPDFKKINDVEAKTETEFISERLTN